MIERTTGYDLLTKLYEETNPKNIEKLLEQYVYLHRPEGLPELSPDMLAVAMLGAAIGVMATRNLEISIDKLHNKA